MRNKTILDFRTLLAALDVLITGQSVNEKNYPPGPCSWIHDDKILYLSDDGYTRLWWVFVSSKDDDKPPHIELRCETTSSREAKIQQVETQWERARPQRSLIEYIMDCAVKERPIYKTRLRFGLPFAK